MAQNNSQASVTRRWHRSIGAGAAVFVVLMVLTGLSLNHSRGLGLDQHHVTQPFLLNWYGLDEPEQFLSFLVGNDWLSFADSQLYLNDQHITSITAGIGAVGAGDLLVAAGSEELLLLNRAGELIERLPWTPSGGGGIEALGTFEANGVAVLSAGQLWLADAQLFNWQRANEPLPTPTWSSAQTAPEALQQAILRQYRGPGLSLERILLDFHSGRIFGSAGVVIFDLLALIVGSLATTGLVLWFRARRNGKRNGASKTQ